MAAEKGNKYTQKFKTPAERKKAYAAFCDHIRQGFSAKSFHDPCVENTILKMMKDHPEDCPPEEIERAKAEGCMVWEKMGMAGAMGKLPNFSASSWIFNMKNRLGWKDKQEHSFDQSAPVVFRMSMGKDLSEKKSKKEK